MECLDNKHHSSASLQFIEVVSGTVGNASRVEGRSGELILPMPTQTSKRLQNSYWKKGKVQAKASQERSCGE